MKVNFIGGGAIGMLYGAMLSLGGTQVKMLTRTRHQAAKLAESGIRLLSAEGEQVAPVEAAVMEEAAEAALERHGGQGAQWFILTVKQTALNEGLLRQLAMLIHPGDSLLCLQNGIGHLERLAAALPGVRLYAGVTSEGARREDIGMVSHTGRGELYYGPAPITEGVARQEGHFNTEPGQKEDPLLEKWQQCVSDAGILAFLSNDMRNRIYHKLLLNAVINPLTAIYGIRNGELPQHSQGRVLMEALHSESEAVLVQAGMEATGGEWDRLLDVCRKTAPNTSSMLADVQAGRKTEIGSINRAVAGLARQLGMKAPLNEAVAEMVNALEPLNG
ncbi:2-dehydropantoate 2-reductase [Paenibacillaceae bacterium GAS479]|nr:2-dehydropantoate 2-reductase [Paenibacillaceae bacterium GAS479]